MKIVVPAKLVPDLVEELDIDPSGTALDTAWLRLIINEFDDHAIEQSILLKEASGGEVSIVIPDVEGAEDVLYTASAKGADRLIKLTGDLEGGVNNHALARALKPLIEELNPDLVLTGVQANDDVDGPVGPLLAEYLGWPYLGYVAGVKVEGGKVVARKEYPGGLVAEMEVRLPAVLGIQAAEQPPRYIAVSLVRQAMMSATIDEHAFGEANPDGGLPVGRMYQPEAAERATMMEGDLEQVAAKIVELLDEAGVL